MGMVIITIAMRVISLRFILRPIGACCVKHNQSHIVNHNYLSHYERKLAQ